MNHYIANVPSWLMLIGFSSAVLLADPECNEKNIIAITTTLVVVIVVVRCVTMGTVAALRYCVPSMMRSQN